MPDITMCTNEDCPLSYSCWRFNCPPSQYQQSYAKFEPQIDEVLDEVECKMYLETPNSEKSDGLGLCVRWGFPALKPNSSTNFNLSTND